MSYSIELLTKHKQELEHSLKKSTDSYKRGSISLVVHNTHLNNLQPKIKDLTISINTLEISLIFIENEEKTINK